MGVTRKPLIFNKCYKKNVTKNFNEDVRTHLSKIYRIKLLAFLAIMGGGVKKGSVY